MDLLQGLKKQKPWKPVRKQLFLQFHFVPLVVVELYIAMCFYILFI